MKNLIIIFICSIIYVTSSSCERMFGDFLEKGPGVDVTEDTIFAAKVYMDRLVNQTYLKGLHSPFPRLEFGANDGWEGAATDEGECVTYGYKTNGWNTGSVTPQSNMDTRLDIRYIAIRQANIVLDRINGVPDADEAYKKRVTAEMKLLRTMCNFESFKYYGGIPILKKRFLITDNMKVPRNTLEETVNAMITDLNEAIPDLPDVVISIEKGRATKGAALAAKAKILLYAASPLFNTGTPYMDLPGHNDLICYGNYDINRWKKAADAAKAVLDWAPAGGVALITDKGVEHNYEFATLARDNSEIIWESKKSGAARYNGGGTIWNSGLPPGIYAGVGGVTVSQNFVQLYEKTDGTNQTWDMVNGGDDLNQKYVNLDPRFKQTMVYNGSRWNADYPAVEIFQGGAQSSDCYGGYWMKKMIPTEEMTYAHPAAMPNGIIFRFAEVYLTYAEALNEAQGPVQEAYDAVNAIRNRSGMPDFPTGLTQSQFRARIWNERAIELFNEEHRLWDLRRWLAAESKTYGGMNGPLWGIKVTKIPGTTPQEFKYEPRFIEDRTFLRRMYLCPWPTNEILKGYLIQNPGY